MIHTAMFQKHKYIYILFHPPVRRPTISTPSLSSHYARFTPAQLESALYTRKCSFIAVLVASAREYKKKKKSGRWIGTRQISFGIKTPLWRRTESTRDHRREKLEEGGRETRRERNINGKGGGGVFRNRGKNTLTWRTWLLSDICIEI